MDLHWNSGFQEEIMIAFLSRLNGIVPWRWSIVNALWTFYGANRPFMGTSGRSLLQRGKRVAGAISSLPVDTRNHAKNWKIRKIHWQLVVHSLTW